MRSVQEGKLEFTFPTGWTVEQYDRWPFYRNRFLSVGGASKAVDIIAQQPHGLVLWLIEVKDYRGHPRRKDSDVWEEVALKARDTLAGLFAAKVDENHGEQSIATAVLGSRRLRVVLHLEQPATSSKLFPRPFDLSKVQQKMRQLVKASDAHPRVVETVTSGHLPWTVHSVRSNQGPS